MQPIARFTRWPVAALSLTLVLLGTQACQPADPVQDEAAAKQPGGTLTYLLSGELLDFDPMTFATPSNPSLLAPRALAVFDALLIEHPEDGSLEPRIAESIESDDGLIWKLKIRPDVQFSDGTPLDAAAVRFNWERIADPANNAPMAPHVQQIETMEVSDPLSLTVTLTEPNAAFPNVVARYLTYIGSPRAIRDLGADFGQNPVGAGAYLVEEYVRDDHLTLVRNPAYYGTTYLDRIVIRPVVDETQRLNTLLTGEADGMYSSNPVTGQQARDHGSGVVTTVLNGGNDIMFNVTQPPFDDLRARLAIAYAFDAQGLSEDLYGGLTEPVDTLFVDTSPFYSPSVSQPAPSRDQAQALLDELAVEGRPLDVTFLVPQSFSARAEWFQTQLASYRNITVELQSVPDSQVAGLAAEGSFHAAFLTSSWLNPDPSLAGFFHTDGTQNWGGYSSSAVDGALEEAHLTTDKQAQQAAFLAVQRALVDDLPSFFYARPNYLVIYGQRVHGVTAVGDGSPLWTSIWVSD